MFGITPFAKVSFAAIGVAFAVATTENVNAADSQVVNAQFLESQTENITLADTEAASIQFQFTVTEPITSAEAESISAQFSATIVEAWGQTPYSVPQQPSIASFAMAGSPFAGSFNTVGFLENPSYVIQSSLLNSITENYNSNTVLTTISQLNQSIVEAWGQTPYSVPQQPSIAAFAMAGSPFAGNFNTNGYLENPSYINQAVLLTSLKENIDIVDIPKLTAQFPFSITEPIIVNDSRATTAQFLSTLIENSGFSTTLNISGDFGFNISELINLNDKSTQISQFFQSLVETLKPIDAPTASANYLQSITETLNLSDQGYIFILTLIDILVAEIQQSYADVYVYQALARTEEAGIVNVTEYNDIQVFAELGEIGLS
jgi:hypothetical protein